MRWRVRGPALEHEAAVAIAAFDEAGLGLDAQEDARMAERGGNSPEPSQATWTVLTRMVSGGGMGMAHRPSNRHLSLQ